MSDITLDLLKQELDAARATREGLVKHVEEQKDQIRGLKAEVEHHKALYRETSAAHQEADIRLSKLSEEKAKAERENTAMRRTLKEYEDEIARPEDQHLDARNFARSLLTLVVALTDHNMTQTSREAIVAQARELAVHYRTRVNERYVGVLTTVPIESPHHPGNGEGTPSGLVEKEPE